MKQIVKIQAASRSNYDGYVVLMQFDRDKPWGTGDEVVYLGKSENYDSHGNYDNSDNSLIFVTKNRKIYDFLCGSGWCVSQQEFIDQKVFTVDDYAEFAALRNGLLKQFKEVREIKFDIDIDKPGSGTPFRFPDWK